MDLAWGPEGGREVSGLEHYHHMHGHTVKETGQPYRTPVMSSETLIKQGYIQRQSHHSGMRRVCLKFKQIDLPHWF